MTDLVTGDTASKLVVTVKDNATSLPVNLTGVLSVKFRWRDNDGAVAVKTATVTDAANGVVEYLFGAGEIIAPSMKIEVEVTDSGGKIMTGLELIELAVREQLG